MVWQKGKTYATALFVQQATEWLESDREDLSPEDRDRLRARVDELMNCSREENLFSQETVEDFLGWT